MRPVICAALLVFFEGIAIWSVFPTITHFFQDLGGEARVPRPVRANDGAGDGIGHKSVSIPRKIDPSHQGL